MEGTAGSFQNASVVRVCTLNARQYLPAKNESKNVTYGCISGEKHSISYLEELESLDVAIHASTRTICPQRSASMERGGSKAATPCSAQKSQASQLSVHPSPQKQKVVSILFLSRTFNGLKKKTPTRKLAFWVFFTITGTKLAKNESTDSHMTLSPQYLRERWKSRAVRTAVILGAPSSTEAVSLKLRLNALVESVTAPCF